METLAGPLPGDAVEQAIARDLARRALLVAPVAVAALGVVRGADAALGTALAIAVVAANFALNAAALGWAARISTGALTAVALGGYVVRLAAVTAIGVGVKQLAAVDFPVFCIVLIVAHLGLLAWELRSVSLSLAAPGLKPAKE